MSQTTAQRTGANVRAELARRGKSQADLAAHLRMSQQSVSKKLRGLVAFDVDELADAAGFLGVSLAVLLGDEHAAA